MALYTSNTISNYNADPPPDDGSTGTDNKVEWGKHKTKLADPIKDLAEAINTDLVTAFASLDTTQTTVADHTTQIAALNQSSIGGLVLSRDAGDPNNDVNVTAGAAVSSDRSTIMVLSSEITKQIDATWVVGDDQGGLDTGAVAADTLYAVWEIYRSDTMVVDVLISTSFTVGGLTLPTSYDEQQLIGYVVTNGSSQIIDFTQSGDYFRMTGDIISDINDTTITNLTPEDGTLSVPPNCLAHIYAQLVNLTTTSSQGGLYIYTKGAADDDSLTREAFAHIQTGDVFDRIVTQGFVLTDANSEITYSATEADGTANVDISTIGCNMLTRGKIVE